MVFNPDLVALSRFQFALTALFHFTFVPITLGVTWLLVIMEGLYLKTRDVMYQDMVKFWGKLLAINVAVGVASGITLEFEFGMNWSYFSHLIGDSFGPILAIEGITAFMLEATMFGLFFFGWNRLTAKQHFLVTCAMALGASLSIVNIISANSWMQHPIATQFDYVHLLVRLKSILALYHNPLAQVRIGHVAAGGFIAGSIFVMGISAYYLLKGRDRLFAYRSFLIAAVFASVALLTSFYFGDENGVLDAKIEPEKLAAIEAQWQTQTAPAAWIAFAIPDEKNQTNHFEVKIPYMLSFIVTKSLTGTVTGMQPLIARNEKKVRDGLSAYRSVLAIRQDQAAPKDYQRVEAGSENIGYALLLKRYQSDLSQPVSEQMIQQAARDSIPHVALCFFAFRIMIAIWGVLAFLTFRGLYLACRQRLHQSPIFFRLCILAIPLPIAAAWFGWMLSEIGRQPWIIHSILPTFMAVSSLPAASVITTLTLYILFYSGLLVVELWLMFKIGRKGPSSLGLKRYHHEQEQSV